MAKKLRGYLKVAYIAAAFAFMFYYLAANWWKLTVYEWQVNIYYMTLAIAMFWLAILGPVFVFRLLFRKLTGHDFGFPRMYRMFNLTFIGRYLPGKVWSVLGMIYYAGEYGIDKRLTTSAVIINEVCYKGSGLLWGLAYYAISRRYDNLSLIILPALIAGMVLIHPRVLNKIIIRLLALFKRETIELSIGYFSILFYFFIYLIFWGVYGSGFYMLIKAIYALKAVDFPVIVAFFPLAWAAGNLAVIIPGGVGVREGLLVLLLSGYVAPEVALIIAILQRIITTLIEAINALISLLIKKGRVQADPWNLN